MIELIEKFFLNYFQKSPKITKKILRRSGMKIGENTTFYRDFWYWAEPYLIEVGHDCQITAGVKVFTHGGAQVAREKIPTFDTFGKVKIGNFTYIGNNALIMPGVTIGSHVLVAAGAVVTKSIPDGVVVAGNPAKYICSVEEYMEKNKVYNINTKKMNDKEKKKFIQKLPEKYFIQKEMLKINR